MSPPLLDRLPDRLFDRIAYNFKTGCWEWTGWCNSAGYGYARWDGRDQGVHRIVMQIAGHSVDGMDVDHLCRNTRCCNPKHLDVVDHATNMDRTRPSRCRRAGHDWSDPRNVYVRKNGRRWCAACARSDYHVKKARA